MQDLQISSNELSHLWGHSVDLLLAGSAVFGDISVSLYAFGVFSQGGRF